MSKGDPALCTLFADLHVMLAHARAGRATVITRYAFGLGLSDQGFV